MRPHSQTAFSSIERVREREERGRARKELGLEVGAQAVAEHRDAEIVRHLAKLQHMALREELSLVDKDAMDLALLQLLADRIEQVDVLVIGVRGRRQGDA